jgi:hypothetical protein
MVQEGIKSHQTQSQFAPQYAQEVDGQTPEVSFFTFMHALGLDITSVTPVLRLIFEVVVFFLRLCLHDHFLCIHSQPLQFSTPYSLMLFIVA